jgi:hypothetical protein
MIALSKDRETLPEGIVFHPFTFGSPESERSTLK